MGPGLLALDAAGNLYLADGGNHRIRLITPDGVISTLAGTGEPGYRDGSADQAQFNLPHGVALDAAGNVYVADMDNNRVRVITPDGEVRTLAGSGQLGYQDGPALEAQFDAPNSLTTDANGNVIVAEAYATELRGTHRLRLITPDGVVTTLAGSGYPGHKDGPASEARFSFPKCPTFDAGGNLLVANGFFHVGLVTPDGVVYTLAGTGEPGRIDGPGPVAQFIEPKCITVGPEGEVYVADGLVQAIRRITYGSPAAVARLPTPNPPSNRRAIKIGFSWVSAGLYGLFAARLAVDEANAAGGVTVNGEPYTLELVVSRACCGDEAAVFGAERLVEQGVVAVVAPLLRQGYMPQSPVYASAGVIHITPGGQDPSFTLEGPPTAYRLGPNVAYGGPVTARYAYEELGVRRAALLPETADFPQTAADAFQKAFETLGGEVFRHDVTAENLPETLNTIREEGAEAVLIFLPTFGFADALLEEVRGAGLPVPIIAYIGFGRINVGMAPESMYDIEPGRPRADMPGYADFAARFRAADFTRDPDRPSEWTTLAYDATNLIIAAIRRAAETGAVTRDSVVAAME
ncbi:MAG: ABC transporter substrate-binding protein, partial [Anaerolineae bacterium]